MSFNSIAKTDIVYEIDDWDLLTSIKSTISDKFSMSVSHYNLNELSETIATVQYDKKINLISFIVDSSVQKLIPIEDIITPKDEVFEKIKVFGFNVKWVDE